MQKICYKEICGISCNLGAHTAPAVWERALHTRLLPEVIRQSHSKKKRFRIICVINDIQGKKKNTNMSKSRAWVGAKKLFLWFFGGSFLMWEGNKRMNKIPPTTSIVFMCFIFLGVFAIPNMTGRPGYRTMEMNGGSSAPYLACTPCVPLFYTLFNRAGNRSGLLDYQGRAGDHFHCTAEPSPGHIRCRFFPGKPTWGLSNGGLGCLSSTVHKCHHFTRKFLL